MKILKKAPRPDARAFTLIELLIVVAIIAVLAGIALPNLLEAQTRAKVSRVKADIAGVRLALEAYAMEYNRYPYYNPGDDHSFLIDVPMLTTPVAYMSSLPRDVFPADLDSLRRRYYRYYPIAFWAFFYPDLRVKNWKWAVVSNGPDRRVDIDRINAQDAIDGFTYMIYNPTNGTLSRGDVFATNLGYLGGDL